MNRLSAASHAWLLCLLMILRLSPLPSALAATWSVDVSSTENGNLQILLDDSSFATYSYRDPQISRPYFANIVVPGGIKVTRNHPPAAGDADDHRDLHPGLWLAFGDISGNDYWRLRAPVKHLRFVERPTVAGSELRFAVENAYLSQTASSVVCQEVCRYQLRASEQGVLLRWDSTFRSDRDDFTFGDQEEMGLGVRLATPIAVRSLQGGRILDSEGRRNEQETWGKQAEWCDYSGTISGVFAGVLLMPSPDNFRQSWYHSRDYGFVAANPFGRQAFTKGEPSRVVVKRGDDFHLRYAVFIHWSSTAAGFDPAAVYANCWPRP